jgi:hypothetical protein
MKPVSAAWTTTTLNGGPASRYGSADDVINLPVYRDGYQIVSCWRPTWRERLAFLFGAPVRLHVLAHSTHSPVKLTVGKGRPE